MLVTGFFFAAVSGNLVGMIGSSNNPISGLTLATTIVAALRMVIVGGGREGVAAVLGVAAVVCVSSAVAGEMLQDLKVGHILGGTPWKMQVGDLIGVVAPASFCSSRCTCSTPPTSPATRDRRLRRAALSAPQAGLMAALSQGIVGGEMAWPLVIVGIAMGVSLILVKVRSPMLFSVGMYLPLETTFAIFVGGLIRGPRGQAGDKRGYNAAQKARVENAGVLTASGLIAGEALMGLAAAGSGRQGTERSDPRVEIGFPQVPGFAGIAGWLAILVMSACSLHRICRLRRRARPTSRPRPPR